MSKQLMENHSSIAESISALTRSVRDHTEHCRKEWECNRSPSHLVTKQDLIEIGTHMAIKLSELKTTVDGIRGQVQKIWNEQQTKYSELQEKWAKLNAQLENQDLADDVATDLKEFAEELQKFDDSIPDLTS